MSKKLISDDMCAKLTDAARAAKAKLDTAANHTIQGAREVTTTVAVFGQSAASKIKATLRHIDANHEAIAEHIDTAAKVTRVAAGVAAVGAAAAAPTGLAAVGVAVGIVSAPVIVTAAPILIGAAAGAATISAAASLYKKARNK